MQRGVAEHSIYSFPPTPLSPSSDYIFTSPWRYGPHACPSKTQPQGLMESSKMAGSSNCTGNVKVIQTMAELEDFLATDKLIVLEFCAPWSEPCKAMIQPFNNIAKTYQNDALFCTSLASELEVEALPTFMVVRDYMVLDEVVGVKTRELERCINRNK
ncbi:unnamed protein product [Urochloa decumbens]|uniref:Thioredoxin domain-containing protein n=1 Tax=Urochloa decumbens TaxID=240449 RepID=A0ABC9D0D8_9POAL